MDKFYITLPSNVVSKEFKNSIANYKTILSKRIELDGDWEVGLATISYTLSWYNLSDKEKITVRYWGDGDHTDKELKFRAGRYEKIEDLIESLNHYFEEYSRKISIPLPRLEYVPAVRKTILKLPVFRNSIVFAEFSENICRMLGFDKEKMDKIMWRKLIEYNNEMHQLYPFLIGNLRIEERRNFRPSKAPEPNELVMKSDHPYEIAGGVHSLYVYCDIVKPSLVGDSSTQLLRFVEIPPGYKYGEQVVLSYPDTHYIQLLNKEFESIEVDIKDDSGNSIPFEFGRSIIVLHFRKQSL